MAGKDVAYRALVRVVALVVLKLARGEKIPEPQLKDIERSLDIIYNNHTT